MLGDADCIENYRAAKASGIKRIVGLSMGAHIGEGSGNLYIPAC